MKTLRRIFVVILLFASFALTIVPANAILYSDVPSNHYAYYAIDTITDYGIMLTNDGEFHPSNDVTRLDTVKALYIFLQEPAVDNIAFPFTDVASADQKYVKWAYSKGITAGTSDTTFSPNVYITREQMCVMIANAYSSYGVYFEKVRNYSNFTDQSDIHSWALPAIKVLYRNKIIDGDTLGRFRPRENISRAQFAVILNALLEQNFFLTVTPMSQGNMQWCWATCATMAGSYKINNPPIPVANVVDYILGFPFDEGGSLEEMEVGARYASNFTRYYDTEHRPLTLGNLLSKIWHHQPVISSGYHISTGNGHAIIVIGCIFEANTVIYINPQTGVVDQWNYTEFVNGSKTGYRWEDSTYQDLDL